MYFELTLGRCPVAVAEPFFRVAIELFDRVQDDAARRMESGTASDNRSFGERRRRAGQSPMFGEIRRRSAPAQILGGAHFFLPIAADGRRKPEKGAVG